MKLILYQKEELKMKKFVLTHASEVGKGEVTRQILEFLSHNGDAELYLNDVVSKNVIYDTIRNHNLTDFMLAQKHKRILKD